MTLPVLYSLRNCPYAMRARLAIYRSQQLVEMRDVVLNNKPPQMIAASAKATVPILVLSPTVVLEESLEIMLWVLSQSDPDNLLHINTVKEQVNHDDAVSSKSLNDILNLVHLFDHEFKPCLEAYKCAKRYHESNLLACRQKCEVYIRILEERLVKHNYLIDEKESMADIALLPFLRQFAKVERQWYVQSSYPQLKRWLNRYLQSPLFNKVMTKYPLWSIGQPVTTFGGI